MWSRRSAAYARRARSAATRDVPGRTPVASDEATPTPRNAWSASRRVRRTTPPPAPRPPGARTRRLVCPARPPLSAAPWRRTSRRGWDAAPPTVADDRRRVGRAGVSQGRATRQTRRGPRRGRHREWGVARDEPVAARTRFLRAVYLLAVGTESLQGRVGAAWLEVVALRREDLPPRLHEAFGAVGA